MTEPPNYFEMMLSGRMQGDSNITAYLMHTRLSKDEVSMVCGEMTDRASSRTSLTHTVWVFSGTSILVYPTFGMFLTTQFLLPEHVDTLLTSSDHTIRASVFCYCKHLTPEQIDIGLSSVYSNVRNATVNNPSCTEEQRVKYHLKWGG